MIEASSGWHVIDWSAPWLAEFRHCGQQAEQYIAQGQSAAQALNHLLGLQPALAGWRFVEQQELPAGMAYESFVHEQQCIPTRSNLHDFFNGLIWLHWPRVKLQLNRLQAQAIARQTPAAPRGALRDAITVLDENGALLLAPAALLQALQQRDWHGLLVQQRAEWKQARLIPIGHALLEKLVQPRKAITAHLLCLPTPVAASSELARLDVQLAGAWQLEPAFLEQKPFCPLPVLGVPGWWAENENVCFYDDPLVFRAPRTTQAIQHRVQPANSLA